MPSPRRVRLQLDRLVMIAAMLLLVSVWSPRASAQPSSTAAARPTTTEITRAIEKVKADPNLATERSIKVLRLKNASQVTPAKIPAWMLWILGFSRWIAQTARVLVWCVVVLLFAFLAAFIIIRLRRASREHADDEGFVAPTHVRNLDIRPETLPADIGAAARALWDAGEHRAALALLYRGLLSRLVHVHAVPIRASSTEGDCLTLASRHLATSRQSYVAHLVRVWQRTVYGHVELDTGTVYALCDRFAVTLDAVDSRPALAEGGAA